LNPNAVTRLVSLDFTAPVTSMFTGVFVSTTPPNFIFHRFLGPNCFTKNVKKEVEGKLKVRVVKMRTLKRLQRFIKSGSFEDHFCSLSFKLAQTRTERGRN